MLIAIAAAVAMLFGGGALEHYLLNIEKPVKTAVVNKQAANEVLDISKELGKKLKARNKELSTLRESFRNFCMDYDSRPDDLEIEAVIDNIVTAHEDRQAHILDARSAMKKNMAEKEWTAVFSNNL